MTELPVAAFVPSAARFISSVWTWYREPLWCLQSRRRAGFKTPKHVFFVDSLPKNPAASCSSVSCETGSVSNRPAT